MTGNEFGKKSYAYAVGCIKASSHPPLTPDRLARLQNVEREDFPKLLDEFGWGKGIEGSVSERIDGEFDYAVRFIKDLSPDKTLTDLLFFETDAEIIQIETNYKYRNINNPDMILSFTKCLETFIKQFTKITQK